MGGVRNREAKKTAAKVFSSGGGTSKGPSTVDKRNQELRCPHCDKVYTQSNQWRLKEHIASKHGDGSKPAEGAAGGGGGAKADDGGGSNSPASASTSMSASSSSASLLASGPAGAAAAPSSSSAAPDPPVKAPAPGPSPLSLHPAAAAAAAAAAGGGGGGAAMMDVGSAGGYFTSKSPKLLLQEHCARNHRPKPRYTRRALDNGLFSCKVVLPDTKRQENDVVIFLDEAFAAPDEQEAQQRAALAALQRVAGERPLHNVLPKQYVTLWHGIGEAETQRKKAATDRAENEAMRRQREKERMAREALRAPQVVVMSESKQRVVQSLLLDVQQQRTQRTQAAADALVAAGGAEPATAAACDPLAAKEASDRLVVLGFRALQAQQALAAVGTAGGTAVLLDWLLLNLPCDQLPSRFRAGSKTNAVTLVRFGDAGAGAGDSAAEIAAAVDAAARSANGGAAGGAGPAAVTAADVSPAAARLSAYGYAPAACEEALQRCDGDEEASLIELFCQVTGVDLRAAATAEDVNGGSGAGARGDAEDGAAGSSSGADDDAEADGGDDAGGGGDAEPGTSGQQDEAWAEEVMVLEMIYAEALTQPNSSRVRLRLTLPDEGQEADGVAGGGGAVVFVEFRRVPGAAPHPQSLPLITVRCVALAPAVVLQLTAALAQEAERLLGEPFLHAVASRAEELLHELPPEQRQGGAASAGAAAAHQSFDNSSDLLLPVLPVLGPDGAAAVAAADGGAEWDDEGFEVGQFQGMALDDEDGQGFADLQHGFADDDNDQRGAARAAPGGGGGGSAAARAGSALNGGGGGGGSAAGGGAAARSAPGGAYRGPRRAYLDVPAEGQRLWQHQQDLDSSSKHAEMRGVRAALPAYGMRAELLRKLAGSAVVVISGATGCGKSTQVPQYILEEAAASGTGGACNIICTQPRRISALGLAHRVSNERGEEVGGTVGYAVRLDTKQSARTRLLFCTTGILLRRLLSEPDLEDLTHVILDEVHERSIEIDLLLLLLRELASRRAAASFARPGGIAPLRVVLMSATADADLFVRYMQARLGDVKGPLSTVTQLTIPGFTHPVREMYLEDVFDLTQYVVTRKSRFAKRQTKMEAQEATAALNGAVAAAATAAAIAELSDEWDAEPPPPPPGVHTEQAIKNLAIVDEEQLNFDLIADLIAAIVARQQLHGGAAFLQGWPALGAAQLAAARSAPGAILVFLPGAPEINRLSRALLSSNALEDAAGGRQNLRILPLHGSLSNQDQARVFVRPPRGVTKIVLATNVAETSITIDDVTVVVDTGRAKEMQYDTERGLLRLQEQWVSQAAAMQRRGRAGRVRPGVCFRLFSTRTWQSLATHTPPEMLRSPLESVCLLIKGMMAAAAAQRALAGGGRAAAPRGGAAAGGFGALRRDGVGEVRVADVLASCLSPPSLPAVVSAVQLLRAIGALDASEQLTGLGQHLNKMPMDPRVGKMLLYGCLLGCLDPVLTVAAALAHGRPMMLSGAFAEAAGGGRDLAAQRAPLLAAAGAQRSDHIALVTAFNAWAHASAKGGRTAGAALCGQVQLSESTLEAVASGRAEYAGVLADLGFLPREAAAELGGARGRQQQQYTSSGARSAAWLAQPANRNASNGRFLKAAICAGFYPNVLRVQHPPARYKQVDGGAFEVDATPSDVKFFDRHRGRAFLHPGSVNFKSGKFDSGWLVFTQMTHTTKLYVRESSMAPVYALLLFGGELRVDHEAGMVRVDEWAEFRAPAVVGVLVAKLRGELDRTLLAKIAEPDLDLAASRALQAVMELLSTDGF